MSPVVVFRMPRTTMKWILAQKFPRGFDTEGFSILRRTRERNAIPPSFLGKAEAGRHLWSSGSELALVVGRFIRRIRSWKRGSERKGSQTGLNM